MKEYNYNDEPLKVTEEETYKTPYEQDLEEYYRKTKRLKNIALSVLVAGVLALNGYGIYKNMTKPEPIITDEYGITYEFDENDWVEPIVNTRYVVPSGYSLTWIDGAPYAVKDTKVYGNITTYTTEDGKTTYAAPSGFMLAYENGQPVAVKLTRTTVDVATVQEYSAPEGFVLVGDKCYRIVDQVKGKGK